jgi:hypothetical protein
MGEDRTYSRTVVTVALLAGVLLGVLGTNVFRAHHPNLPSPTAYTAPQPLSTVGDSLAVEAYVDSNGRIQDYRVLSATKNLLPQTKNTLIFTTFRPATFMGKPTNGTATLIFSNANGTVASSSQAQ